MSSADAKPALNNLVNGELASAHLYWQAAGWCFDRHLDGCGEFLLAHADEELTHMRKMMRFMIDSDITIRLDALPEPAVDVDSVLALFEKILAHEQKVTDSIGHEVNKAQACGDHSTFEFLQWFVMEQRGEMKLFRDIVDRIKLIGDGPQALYFIDQEVAGIGASAAAMDQAAPNPTAVA
ncbi:MAG: ferritin [Pseudomonadota bacterium]